MKVIVVSCNQIRLYSVTFQVMCRIFIVWCPLKSSTGVEWLDYSQKIHTWKYFVLELALEYLGKLTRGTFCDFGIPNLLDKSKGIQSSEEKYF